MNIYARIELINLNIEIMCFFIMFTFIYYFFGENIHARELNLSSKLNVCRPKHFASTAKEKGIISV